MSSGQIHLLNSIVFKLTQSESRSKPSRPANRGTLQNCFEIQGEVAEQIVMSPLGSCNKVIFLLHFA